MSVKRLVPRWFAVMILASLAIIGYGVTQPSTTTGKSDPVVTHPRELVDVLWLDREPGMTTDPWKAYIFTPENIGISIDAASSYKLTLEFFEFKADAKKIAFRFPHDNRAPSSPYKVEKMKKPSKYFDTTLTLEADPQNGGAQKVFYTGPDFRSASRLPHSVLETLEKQHLLEYLPE